MKMKNIAYAMLSKAQSGSRMNSGAWLGCHKPSLGCVMNNAAYIFILSIFPSAACPL